MWDRIDDLLRLAPHARALEFHRVELLEARRRRAGGIALGPDLVRAEATAALGELATPVVLRRVREACDGALVLIKGPEVARDYPAPRLRPFNDVDLLAEDARAAQAALLRAGFREVGEEWRYRGIHHLRPLEWPGLPLLVELHERPKWPTGVGGPAPAELIGARMPGRLGVAGIDRLPPAHHALVLAAHAWAHEPLARLGQLVDVAAVAARADVGEIDALARRWGCAGLWRTTWRATRALTGGGDHSAALALWGRHLGHVRERTVLEAHAAEWAAPLWVRGRAGLPRALRRDADESWPAKLARARLALAHARVSRPDHERRLLAQRPVRGEGPAQRL